MEVLDDEWADGARRPAPRRRRLRRTDTLAEAPGGAGAGVMAAEPARAAGGAAAADVEAEAAAAGGAAAAVPSGVGERAAMLAQIAASGMFGPTQLPAVESLEIDKLRHLVSSLPK
eukprot:3733240-Pyramimonas_sp.AAC.1